MTPPASLWAQGWPIQFPVDGQPLIDGTFNGQGPVWWVIDTGASTTYADMLLTGTESFVQADLTVGPLNLPDHHVGSVELVEAEAFMGWDLGGLVGQDIFARRFVAVDYAGQEAYFSDFVPTEPPPAVARSTPFELPYDISTTIPIATVGLGSGLSVPLIADTGSGVTLITDDIFAQIDDGTLPRLGGYVWATTYGAGDAFVTRIPTIEINGIQVKDTWAVVVPANSPFFALMEASGIPAKGFLGYPVYRHFVLGIDGINKRYLMWPQATSNHIDPQEWTRVGIEPTIREGKFYVEMLYTPSDAATQGLETGDEIVALDGAALTTYTLDDLKLALRGMAGTSKTLKVLRRTREITATVQIEELLPGQPSTLY